MSLLQSGRVHLGFLGAAEVDRFGNLNSTEVRGAKGMTRLPGSGGACDIASLAHRFVALLEHSRERLPERVSYVTSPGNGDGRGWRQRVGLIRGGPAAVITSKAVLRFGDDGEAYLSSTHPGIEVEDVLRNTGWPLRVSDEVHRRLSHVRKSSRQSANTIKTVSGQNRMTTRNAHAIANHARFPASGGASHPAPSAAQRD